MTMSLFDQTSDDTGTRKEELCPGAFVLHGFALQDETALLNAFHEVTAKAPFRHMVTPGGFRMSVAMTNCGSLGWVTDRTGYRYDVIDAESGQPWPPMPAPFLKLAQDAAAEAGFAGFVPDACLAGLGTGTAALAAELCSAGLWSGLRVATGSWTGTRSAGARTSHASCRGRQRGSAPGSGHENMPGHS